MGNIFKKSEGWSNAPGFTARLFGSAISTLLIYFLAQMVLTKGMAMMMPPMYYVGVFVIIFITQCSTFIF